MKAQAIMVCQVQATACIFNCVGEKFTKSSVNLFHPVWPNKNQGNSAPQRRVAIGIYLGFNESFPTFPNSSSHRVRSHEFHWISASESNIPKKRDRRLFCYWRFNRLLRYVPRSSVTSIISFAVNGNPPPQCWKSMEFSNKFKPRMCWSRSFPVGFLVPPGPSGSCRISEPSTVDPCFRTISVWNPVISLAIDHRCRAVLGPNLPARGYALHASNDFQRNVTSKIKQKNDMPCLQVTRDILKLENQDTSNPTVQLKSVHSCRWLIYIYMKCIHLGLIWY